MSGATIRSLLVARSFASAAFPLQLEAQAQDASACRAGVAGRGRRSSLADAILLMLQIRCSTWQLCMSMPAQGATQSASCSMYALSAGHCTSWVNCQLAPKLSQLLACAAAKARSNQSLLLSTPHCGKSCWIGGMQLAVISGTTPEATIRALHLPLQVLLSCNAHDVAPALQALSNAFVALFPTALGIQFGSAWVRLRKSQLADFNNEHGLFCDERSLLCRRAY